MTVAPKGVLKKEPSLRIYNNTVSGFLIINQLDKPISQSYFGMKLYVFRTVLLSIIKSFPLYTQKWYMSYRFSDSLQAVSKPV